MGSGVGEGIGTADRFHPINPKPIQDAKPANYETCILALSAARTPPKSAGKFSLSSDSQSQRSNVLSWKEKLIPEVYGVAHSFQLSPRS